MSPSGFPDARFVELPGDDHLPFVGDQDAMLDEIEEFLTGSRRSLELDRVLATVMCGCVCQRPAGDGAARPDRSTASTPTRARSSSGSGARRFDLQPGGFISTFDGPARAIRCACAHQRRGAALRRRRPHRPAHRRMRHPARHGRRHRGRHRRAGRDARRDRRGAGLADGEGSGRRLRAALRGSRRARAATACPATGASSRSNGRPRTCRLRT